MGFVILTIIVVIALVFLLSRQQTSPPPPREPGQLTTREKRDLEEMQREAPNAAPQYFEDGIVWYERTTQGGRSYHLAYWHENGDYKAAVMEGDKPTDRGQPQKCHLYDDRTICLKGASEPPYTRIAEARARAILWALGYSEYLKTGEFPWNEVK